MADFWHRIWDQHPGALLGTALGFVWGFLALKLGLIAALFLAATCVAGYLVGRRFDGDDNQDLGDFVDQILSRYRRG